MFVVSRRQLMDLVEPSGITLDESAKLDSFVDLGAGDGRPTLTLRPFFSNRFATEASWAMRRILGRDGFTLLEIDDWHEGRTFDFITCLNLLDRCDEPLSVLGQIRGALKEDTGLLLLAAVLPFKPYVEFKAGHKPTQRIEAKGKTFAEQAQSLARVIEGEGFQLVSWTKVPYMCEGDLVKSVYTLNDVVFLFKAKKGFQKEDISES